jgi:hypothetical protein
VTPEERDAIVDFLFDTSFCTEPGHDTRDVEFSSPQQFCPDCVQQRVDTLIDAERERCAKVAENYRQSTPAWWHDLSDAAYMEGCGAVKQGIAATIRAGEEPTDD